MGNANIGFNADQNRSLAAGCFEIANSSIACLAVMMFNFHFVSRQGFNSFRYNNKCKISSLCIAHCINFVYNIIKTILYFWN